MIKTVIICFIFNVLFVNSAKLPSYFTKCKLSDPKLNECVFKNIKDNWLKIVEGDNSVHLQKLNPLLVSHMQVTVDVNLSGNLTDGTFYGYSDNQVKNVSWDTEKKTFEIDSYWPFSSIVGTYHVVGKLLNLQIADSGRTNVTFVGVSSRHSFTYDIKERKHNKYIEIKDATVKIMDVKRIYFDIQLSNNNLGEVVSNALNDNWKELSNQVESSVGLSLGELNRAIFQPFFNKVSLDELFDP